MRNEIWFGIHTPASPIILLLNTSTYSTVSAYSRIDWWFRIRWGTSGQSEAIEQSDIVTIIMNTEYYNSPVTGRKAVPESVPTATSNVISLYKLFVSTTRRHFSSTRRKFWYRISYNIENQVYLSTEVGRISDKCHRVNANRFMNNESWNLSAPFACLMKFMIAFILWNAKIWGERILGSTLHRWNPHQLNIQAFRLVYSIRQMLRNHGIDDRSIDRT